MKHIHMKSQITILIIAGLVVMVLAGFVLYLTKYIADKKAKSTVSRSYETSLDVPKVKEFATKCVEKLAKDAIVLLGRQGGYIYRSEGGTLMDFANTDIGIFFINYGSHKVAYDIFPPRNSIPPDYFAEPPAYPWASFPYETESSTQEIYSGVFGINTMPPLEPSKGPHSIQSQIESYVDKNMHTCLDFSVMSDKFQIETNSSSTEVVIGSSDINVRSHMPITVISISTKQKAYLDEFSATLNVRMSKFYSFAKELIDLEVSDIKFDINSTSNDKDSFEVKLEENVYPNDDIITITDSKSMIYGKPFEYTFARRDRAPALHYVRNNRLNFPPLHSITLDDLMSGEELRAYDSDEDELTFTISPSVPYELDTPAKTFTVEVSDGKLRDWQTIEVIRT